MSWSQIFSPILGVFSVCVVFVESKTYMHEFSPCSIDGGGRTQIDEAMTIHMKVEGLVVLNKK